MLFGSRQVSDCFNFRILLENIILWNEFVKGGELGIALSFQESSGCHHIW
jgi:hypothetical protein